MILVLAAVDIFIKYDILYCGGGGGMGNVHKVQVSTAK